MQASRSKGAMTAKNKEYKSHKLTGTRSTRLFALVCHKELDKHAFPSRPPSMWPLCFVPRRSLQVQTFSPKHPSQTLRILEGFSATSYDALLRRFAFLIE